MNHPTFDTPSLEDMGALLPAFDFTELIASDAFDAVYLAQQRSLERNVAIKILAPTFSEDPSFQQHFGGTARSMAKLNHPNLIRVYDSGCIERMLYVVMEFVPGKPLSHSTRGQTVEFHQTMLLIGGICEGLAHAHDHQIIHGNLTPSNILLNAKAEPKIGNFGFAPPREAEAACGANSRFIAPELLANPDHADHRADVFSVGAILYELLTGQSQSPDAAPPSGFSGCGPEIDDIWRRATHQDPSQRFPDIRSLAAALPKAAAGARPPVTSAIPVSKRLATHSGPSPGGPPVSPAPPSKHMAAPPPSGNGKLIRNLFIIGGLLIAIPLAWQARDDAHARRDKENREAMARSKAAKEKAHAEARERALNLSRHPSPAHPADASGNTEPHVPEVAESPAESLQRLRKDLASGSRTEMPVGTIQKGEHAYFLVSDPMSWPDAAWFAEQHGGHLAIPNASADLTWLVNEVAAGEGAWVGAAKSGRNAWALADGSAWIPAKAPTGIGQYLGADKHGFLRAENAGAVRQFIIQWHRDGSNPGTLDALLTATRASLSQPNPLFPPGTRTFGVRQYLFVSRPLPWREAADLAEKAGGHLAVPSATAEIINLEEMTDELDAKHPIWLGGFLKGDHWLWITGEPWKTAKWIEGTNTSTPDSALIIRPGKGWDARAATDTASGFIIEWSNDRNSGTAPQVDAPASAGNAVPIDRARDLIMATDAKRQESLADNIKKFTWDLDQFLRPLPKGSQITWKPHVERLKDCIKDQRLPSTIPDESGIEMAPEMAKLLQFHFQKQEKIDLDFMAGAEKIRVAFIDKLKQAQTQAIGSGQPKVAESIGEMLAAADSLATWVRTLGVELQPKNPEVPAAAKAAEPPATGGLPVEGPARAHGAGPYGSA